MATLLQQAEQLQNLLVAQATGGNENDADYHALRQVFLSEAGLAALVPSFVTSCRSLFQFWQFIKYKFGTYRERREFVWHEFAPLLSHLENRDVVPSDAGVSDALEAFDAANIYAAWSKALERRQNDPEGAITAARTLLESTCKHVLDEMKVPYEDTADLPKLYALTSKALNLAPSQHTEQIFKQVLGGCSAVVEGLGALRNRLSDAHGRGRAAAKPAPRHAELAVNLAGAAAAFLIGTLTLGSLHHNRGYIQVAEGESHYFVTAKNRSLLTANRLHKI